MKKDRIMEHIAVSDNATNEFIGFLLDELFCSVNRDRLSLEDCYNIDHLLLNGASGWIEYSFSGSALTWDEDLFDVLRDTKELEGRTGDEIDSELLLEVQATYLAAAADAIAEAVEGILSGDQMSLDDLPIDWISEVKVDVLVDRSGGKHLSLGEFLDADNLISDAELYAKYGSMVFKRDDFVASL